MGHAYESEHRQRVGGAGCTQGRIYSFFKGRGGERRIQANLKVDKWGRGKNEKKV